MHKGGRVYFKEKNMKIIFGKKLCVNCQEKKKKLNKKGIKYRYFDLDTYEGLAMAAYLDVNFSNNVELPIVMNVASNDLA